MARMKGPKAWKSRSKKSAPKRRYSRPKWSRKSAITLSGIRAGLGSAPYKHVFTRDAPVTDIVSTATGPSVSCLKSTGGTGDHLFVGAPAADFSGVPNLYGFGASMEFHLNDLPNNTDFTDLFDEYRIDQIDVEIQNLHNSAVAGDSVNVMPSVLWCPDFDDATVPSNATELSERQRTKSWTFRGDNKPCRFSIKPRVAQGIYKPSALGTPAYAVGPPAWLDNTETTVPHYGLKLFFQNCYMNSTGGQKGETHFRIVCKYHLSFKDPA